MYENLFESMEARRLMTVIPVTNTNDAGAGSLRQALVAAVDGDTVDLTGINGNITLSTGQLVVTGDITLKGPGQANLTVSAGNSGHILVVNNTASLIATGLTLADGNTDTSGGAILNRGDLTLNDVTVKNNRAYLFGGGIYSLDGNVTLLNSTITGNTVQGALEARGGGLYMDGGTLTINGCTFSGNTAVGKSNTGLTSGPAFGGAMYLTNTANSTVTNGTFGNNTATGGTGGILINNGQAYGGAIYISSANGTLFNHCTIAYNTAAGGGMLSAKANSQGGGLYSTGGGTVSLQSTISALNTAMNSPDLLNTIVSSLGNNLIGISSGSSFLNGILGDLVGTMLAPYAPNLLPLADNGGLTFTYGLASNSPAINAGAVGAPNIDQRGFGRRDAADIGAYETNPNHLPAIAVPSVTAVAGVRLSQTIAATDADNDTLVYSSSDLPSWMKIETVNGVTSLVGTPSELNAEAGVRVHLTAFDGFQSTTTLFTVKVGIPGIDLSPAGLLRLNGTEFDDELTVRLIDDNTVRVYRDGFKRNFALADIKKVQIFGFAGRDNILVDIGRVRATIFAGADNDTVQGGAGADYISGGEGDDSLFGGNGADRIDADDGRDRVYGETGDDTLHGGAGRDIVDGGIGRNRLFGDGGNDTLIARLGNRDILDGGEGTNTGDWNERATVVNAVLAVQSPKKR